MSSNNIIKFLRLKDVSIKTVKAHKNYVEIYMRPTHPRPKACKNCNYHSLYFHDRRTQRLIDIPYNHKFTYFILERIRYICPKCKQKTTVNPSFLIKNCKITGRLELWIMEEFTKMKTSTDIAKECGVSITTVQRCIEKIDPVREKLPEVLCIDEFKGDSGNNKYQVTLGDGKNHNLIDILPTRYKNDLEGYFRSISKDERKNVKYYVSDMSKVFKEVKETCFPKSIHIIDKYHFVRQVYWR